MTDAQRAALGLAARLFAYPNEEFWDMRKRLAREIAAVGSEESGQAFARAATEFLAKMTDLGMSKACSEYVATFDHASAASPYLAWHRYGNDRGQGRALAALNGLYRTAGFEPLPGAMPDYLPRVLEFLAIGPDWAQEALLDGFGPELNALIGKLQEMQNPWSDFLDAAIAPLRLEFPERFRPRQGRDPTMRPMARPEPEMM